jgi:hypothetical protein
VSAIEYDVVALKVTNMSNPIHKCFHRMIVGGIHLREARFCFITVICQTNLSAARHTNFSPAAVITSAAATIVPQVNKQFLEIQRGGVALE